MSFLCDLGFFTKKKKKDYTENRLFPRGVSIRHFKKKHHYQENLLGLSFSCFSSVFLFRQTVKQILMP